MSRFQRDLRAIKHMVAPYHPPKRPTFLTDDELIAKQTREANRLGPNSIKPLSAGELDARVRMARDFVGEDGSLPNG